MEIIFEGRHDSEQAAEHLLSVVRLFNERYKIANFREMSLSVTLVDDQGQDVELVDSKTSQAYRTFEVYSSGAGLRPSYNHRGLKLVVDNTRQII